MGSAPNSAAETTPAKGPNGQPRSASAAEGGTKTAPATPAEGVDGKPAPAETASAKSASTAPARGAKADSAEDKAVEATPAKRPAAKPRRKTSGDSPTGDSTKTEAAADEGAIAPRVNGKSPRAASDNSPTGDTPTTEAATPAAGTDTDTAQDDTTEATPTPRANGKSSRAASDNSPGGDGATGPSRDADASEGAKVAIGEIPEGAAPGGSPAAVQDVTGSASGADKAPGTDAGDSPAQDGNRTATAPTKSPSWSARWRANNPRAAQGLSLALTVVAAILVVMALVMPSSVVGIGPAKFLRLPGEAIVGAAVMLALPRRPRVILAAVSGVVLAVVTVLNWLDMGFHQYLGRNFNMVLDWTLLGDAQSYLEDSLGRTATLAATAGLIVVVLLMFVALALSVVRLSNLVARHQSTATRATLIAGVAWITCSSLGLEMGGLPFASDTTAVVMQSQAKRVADSLRDEAEFGKVAKVDAFGNTPPAQLVPDLRGKDMLFTFIESYGRSAIEDPIMAPGVDKTLDVRTKALAKAGYHAKSGWLTSATYGGSSWLGHSTTLSGLWISNQQRYRTVMASDHLSLTKVFKKTGDWDTVGVMPGVQKAWPEQSYYGLDKVYNAFELGYKGPKFSWSTMPDQYALEQFQKRVHGKKRTDGKSLMSEVILTSSHQPWAPIPKMVGWDQLGDGSIFKGIEAAGNKSADVIADTTKSRQEYGKSIQYSVTALTEWLTRYGSKDTVLVFLGDHQPIARVSGNHASRDVPISIVAKDPKVLDKVANWGWSDGLRPAHDAPVWKMSAFRDRFLTAYGSTPHPKKG
ncbi:CDP-alcohol phosphatidyltransferase [Streptomyces sp. NPDC005435]|uniref:CDP-alcohol phosphatidyltransferase n=1 Tax=Streptomyces sp. NPDC005435 TaxID=3154464 RepID=UPI003453258F